jgi:signal peptidase I
MIDNQNNNQFRSGPADFNNPNIDNEVKKDVVKKAAIRENLYTLLILLAAPLLAVLIINFVFRTYQVDGPSMESTLQDQDRLIILKVPKTISKITGNDYIPNRYDIIVFTHRGGFDSPTGERQLIKRVIGLPGDRVVIKDNLVTVYNKEHPSGFLVDRFGPESGVITITGGNIDETVKDGEVFVMGDNRENSLDSRGLGTVQSEDIVGKLTFRIFPFHKLDKF